MRIIVVDGDKNTLAGSVNSVRETVPGASVTGFDIHEEALEYCRNSLVDVAILNIGPGDKDGIGYAKKIRALLPSCNVIFTADSPEYAYDAFSLHASGYVLKPLTPEKLKRETEDLRYPSAGKKDGITLRTFGDFEVFCNGSPVLFKYKKTKELLAYLVDRNGALVASGDIMVVLWEDDDDKSNYLKQLKHDLKNTLSELGYEHIIVKQRGSIGILKDAVFCDYYEWLKGNRRGTNAYRGEYMNQYSWAEITHAALESKSQHFKNY